MTEPTPAPSVDASIIERMKTDSVAYLRRVANLDEGDGLPKSAARMRKIADELERLRKLEGTDDHPEHRCKRCGGRNIVWNTDSDLWNRVAGDFSILCPICFCELASEAGIEPVAWRLSMMAKPDPASFVPLHVPAT